MTGVRAPPSGPNALPVRRRLREIVTRGGGVVGTGDAMGTAGPVPEVPFGTAQPVEGSTVRGVPVAGISGPAPDAAFADGIQRFAVEGWIGVAPVVRAQVAAGVLVRRDGRLSPDVYRSEEFIVAPVGVLGEPVVRELQSISLPLYDSGTADRLHPMLDVQRAVQIVDRRRRAAERKALHEFRKRDADRWLVVDGALRGFESLDGPARLLGVIKSHETQFLAGADLETALTLPAGHRTTVFFRSGVEGDPVHSWYLRLWDWTDRHILHGLIRVERPPHDRVVREVDEVSRWLLAERAPLSRDTRWDRLLYPIHEVENYLRARVGGWE